MWVIKDLIIHFEKRLSHSEIQYLVDKGFIEPYLLKGDYGYYQYVDYGYGEVYFSYNLFGENTEIEEIVEKLPPKLNRSGKIGEVIQGKQKQQKISKRKDNFANVLWDLNQELLKKSERWQKEFLFIPKLSQSNNNLSLIENLRRIHNWFSKGNLDKLAIGWKDFCKSEQISSEEINEFLNFSAYKKILSKPKYKLIQKYYNPKYQFQFTKVKLAIHRREGILILDMLVSLQIYLRRLQEFSDEKKILPINHDKSEIQILSALDEDSFQIRLNSDIHISGIQFYEGEEITIGNTDFKLKLARNRMIDNVEFHKEDILEYNLLNQLVKAKLDYPLNINEEIFPAGILIQFASFPEIESITTMKEIVFLKYKLPKGTVLNKKDLTIHVTTDNYYFAGFEFYNQSIIHSNWMLKCGYILRNY